MRPAISYQLVGEGEPVLLLHGLGGDHRQSLGLLPNDAPFARLAPDLPAHGDTDLLDAEPLGFEAFAELADGLLVRYFNRPAHIVGVSMGAGVASTLASRYPERCRSLVLIRPSWLDTASPAHLAPFPVVADLLERLGPIDGAGAFQQTEVFQSVQKQAPAMAGSLLGQFTRHDAVPRARVLRDLPADRPMPDQAAYTSLGERFPVTVIAAPDDPVHPLSLAQQMHTWIPGSRFVEVPRKLADPTEHNAALRTAVAQALIGGAR